MNPVDSLDELGDHAELRQRLLMRAAAMEVSPRSLASVSVHESPRPHTSRRASIIALAIALVVVTLVGINIVTRRNAVTTPSKLGPVTSLDAELVPSTLQWSVQPTEYTGGEPAGEGPFYSVNHDGPGEGSIGQSDNGVDWTFSPANLDVPFESPKMSVFGSTAVITGATLATLGDSSGQRLPSATVSLDGGTTWRRAYLPGVNTAADSVVAEENSTSATGTVITFRVTPKRNDVSPSTGVVRNHLLVFVMTPDQRSTATFSQISLPAPSPSAVLFDTFAKATPNGFVVVAGYDTAEPGGTHTTTARFLTSVDGTVWSQSALPPRAAQSGRTAYWRGQPVMAGSGPATPPLQAADLRPVIELSQGDGSWLEVDLGGIVTTSCACAPIWSQTLVEAVSANDTVGITVSVRVRSGAADRLALLNTIDGTRWSVDWVDQVASGGSLTTDWIVSGSSILTRLSAAAAASGPAKPLLLVGTPISASPGTTEPATTSPDQTDEPGSSVPKAPAATFVLSQLTLTPLPDPSALPPGNLIGEVVGNGPFLAWFRPSWNPKAGGDQPARIVRSSDGVHWEFATTPPINPGGIVAIGTRFVAAGVMPQPGNAQGTVAAVATSLDAGNSWTMQQLSVARDPHIEPVLDATVSTSTNGIAANSSTVMVAVATKTGLDAAALIAHSHLAPNTVDDTGAPIDLSKATGAVAPGGICPGIALLAASGASFGCPSMTQFGLNQATQTALLGFTALFVSTDGAPFAEVATPNPGWTGGNALASESLAYENGSFVLSRSAGVDIPGGAGGTGYPVVPTALVSRDGTTWTPGVLPCGDFMPTPANGASADRVAATCQVGAGDFRLRVDWGDRVSGWNAVSLDGLLPLLGPDVQWFSPNDAVVTKDGITIVGFVDRTSDVLDPNGDVPRRHTAIVLHSNDGMKWSYRYVGDAGAGSVPPAYTDIGLYKVGNRVVVYAADRGAPGSPTFSWLVRSTG